MEPDVESCDPRRLSDLLATAESVSPPIPLTEGPGSRIGRYKLLQLIGEGGFGSVFMAEQVTPVVRKVALKIIKLGMDTKQVIARFEAERQALAMMDHPNIARVLDAGATETGRPYFVMELVKGIPITDYCDQAHLPAQKRLELFAEVCKAVQHAHTKGIIHRDLKPGNVLVTLHDGTPVPKVIDFGIAKATNQRLTEQTLFTEFRLFLGTPQYMSPEQAEISGLDVDTRSDVYSLGVLLYELLTGTTPLDPAQLRRSAYAELQRIIREVEPPKPSTRLSTLGAGLQTVATRMGTEPAKLNRLVAGELDWIVMKCLEKDRDRRYETANALARDVERYLHDEPVEASPPSTTYKVRKVLRKHKREAAAVIAVIAALGLGFIGTSIGLAQARHGLAAARKAEQKEAAERKQADAVAARLEAIFNHLDPHADDKGGPDLRTQLVSELDKLAADLNKGATGDPLVQSRLLHSLSNVEWHLGELAKAVAMEESAVGPEKTILPGDDARRVAMLAQLAKFYNRVGRHAEAARLQEQVRDWRTRALGPDNPDTLMAEHALAATYGRLGRPAEATRLLEDARNRQAAMLGPEHGDTLETMADLAAQYEVWGRVAEAINLMNQVRDFQIRKLGPDHPDTLGTLRRLAHMYVFSGRMQEGITLLQQVRDQQLKKLGPEHPDTLATLEALGETYLVDGRTPEATELLERLQDSMARRLGQNDPATLDAAELLARAYARAGRIKEAITLMVRTRERAMQKLGPDHLATLGATDWLACLYLDSGRTTDAIPLLEQLRASQLPKFGPDFPACLETLAQLGHAYRQAGRVGEAIDVLEQAYDGMSRNLGPGAPDTIVVRRDLATTYWVAGQPEKAVKLCEQVRDQEMKQFGPGDRRTLNAMYDLADYYLRSGRTTDAGRLLEEVRQRAINARERDDDLARSATIMLARVYRSEGRPDDVRRAAQLSRQAFLKTLRERTDKLAKSPSDAQLVADRGELYAELGRFREAADDYARAVEAQPDNHVYWHDGLLPLLLQLGDLDRFRQRRSEELRRFSGATGIDVAHRVAKDAFMLPLDGADLKLAAALADGSLAAGPSYWAAWQTKGMAEYRSGHYREAIPWFLKTKGFADIVYSHTVADLFLAMCYQRLGDREQARAALARAVHTMDTEFPHPEEGDVIDTFSDWTLCQVIRREAEGLIGGGPATRPVTVPK